MQFFESDSSEALANSVTTEIVTTEIDTTEADKKWEPDRYRFKFTSTEQLALGETVKLKIDAIKNPGVIFPLDADANISGMWGITIEKEDPSSPTDYLDVFAAGPVAKDSS